MAVRVYDRGVRAVRDRLVAGTALLVAGVALRISPTPTGGAAAALLVGGVAIAGPPVADRVQERLRRPPEPVVWSPAAKIVAGLCLIGLAIRLLVGRGLWLDEAISVSQARLPLPAMLDVLRTQDIHPPGYQLVLWVFVRLFGDGELAVRMPSMLAGTALIGMLYLAGRDLYGRRTAVVAAALGTVSPLLVWYSQEARMYALLMLVAVAAVWAQVRAHQRGRTNDWIAFGALGAALVWLHYFAVLQLVVQHVAAAIHGRRTRDVRGWIAALGVTAGLALPVVVLFVAQMGSSVQLEALAVPSRNPSIGRLDVYTVFANTVWALWGYHSSRTMTQLVALWPLAMLFALLLLGRARRDPTRLLLAVALIPMGAVLLAGFKLRDLFEVRYFAMSIPILVLFAAYLVTHTTRMATGVAAAILVVSQVLALADQQLSQDNPRRYDFRGSLASIANEAEPGDLVLYAPRYLDSVVGYYAPGVAARPLIGGPPSGVRGRIFVLTSLSLNDRQETPIADRRVLDQIARTHRPLATSDHGLVEVRLFGNRARPAAATGRTARAAGPG